MPDMLVTPDMQGMPDMLVMQGMPDTLGTPDMRVTQAMLDTLGTQAMLDTLGTQAMPGKQASMRRAGQYKPVPWPLFTLPGLMISLCLVAGH